MGNLKNLREEFNEINLKFCQILLSKMALGDDKFSKPEGKFYRDKNGSLREREEIEVPEDESAVSSLFASVEKKKVHRSDQENAHQTVFRRNGCANFKQSSIKSQQRETI